MIVCRNLKFCPSFAEKDRPNSQHPREKKKNYNTERESSSPSSNPEEVLKKIRKKKCKALIKRDLRSSDADSESDHPPIDVPKTARQDQTGLSRTNRVDRGVADLKSAPNSEGDIGQEENSEHESKVRVDDDEKSSRKFRRHLKKKILKSDSVCRRQLRERAKNPSLSSNSPSSDDQIPLVPNLKNLPLYSAAPTTSTTTTSTDIQSVCVRQCSVVLDAVEHHPSLTLVCGNGGNNNGQKGNKVPSSDCNFSSSTFAPLQKTASRESVVSQDGSATSFSEPVSATGVASSDEQSRLQQVEPAEASEQQFRCEVSHEISDCQSGADQCSSRDSDVESACNSSVVKAEVSHPTNSECKTSITPQTVLPSGDANQDNELVPSLVSSQVTVESKKSGQHNSKVSKSQTTDTDCCTGSGSPSTPAQDTSVTSVVRHTKESDPVSTCSEPIVDKDKKSEVKINKTSPTVKGLESITGNSLVLDKNEPVKIWRDPKLVSSNHSVWHIDSVQHSTMAHPSGATHPPYAGGGPPTVPQHSRGAPPLALTHYPPHLSPASHPSVPHMPSSAATAYLEQQAALRLSASSAAAAAALSVPPPPSASSQSSYPPHHAMLPQHPHLLQQYPPIHNLDLMWQQKYSAQTPAAAWMLHQYQEGQERERLMQEHQIRMER